MAARTIDNCMIRKKYECDTVDSRCEGIQRSEWDDEPAPPCDTCKFNLFYESDETKEARPCKVTA